MQCPKCKYEPTLAESQSSPNDCVKCGVNYEGHARYLANIAAQRSAEIQRAALAKVKPAGPGEVTVVDVSMPFWSMVVFMVKWAIAAIPAMIILIVVLVFLVMVLGGLFGGIAGLRGISGSAPANQSGSAPELIADANLDGASFWLLSMKSDGSRVEMIVRTDERGGAIGYSKFVVDCRSGRGLVVAIERTREEVEWRQATMPLERIAPNTPRHAIARRGCAGIDGTHESLMDGRA